MYFDKAVKHTIFKLTQRAKDKDSESLSNAHPHLQLWNVSAKKHPQPQNESAYLYSTSVLCNCLGAKRAPSQDRVLQVNSADFQMQMDCGGMEKGRALKLHICIPCIRLGFFPIFNDDLDFSFNFKNWFNFITSLYHSCISRYFPRASLGVSIHIFQSGEEFISNSCICRMWVSLWVISFTCLWAWTNSELEVEEKMSAQRELRS